MKPWQSADLFTSATTQSPGGTWQNSTLGDLRDGGRAAPGDTVYVYVRAFDNAGLSTLAVSNGTLVVLY